MPSWPIDRELRRMRMEAKRYRPGWTSLGMGEKEKREVALAAGVKVGSRGWATRRMPPHRALERGVRSRPPSPLIIADLRRDRQGR